MMCTVAGVAKALGISIDTSDDSEFTTVGRPGSALGRALTDLEGLGLLTWSVSGGIKLAAPGRDAVDTGLETLWPDFLSTYLRPQSDSFLARLVMLSIREGSAFVDVELIDAFEVASTLGWPIIEFDDRQDVFSTAQDLINKDFAIRVLVEQEGAFGIRATYRGIVRATEMNDLAGARSGLIDWSNPPDGWEDIEGRIRDLKLRLDSASSVDDYKDVGRRSRDLISDVVNRLYDVTERATEATSPTAAETKKRFDTYVGVRFPDNSSYEELRAFMRKALDLANATTHGGTTDHLRALASAQATIGLIRIVEAVERTEPAAARSDKSIPFRP